MISDKFPATQKTHSIISDGTIWFFLAFLIGLLIRVINLKDVVFTQGELGLAYQSMQVSRRIAEGTSEVPAYTGLTSITFFLFEASNFLARVWPAVVGSGLILLPLAWRDKLGQKASLILSFALALDPTMIVFSRAINGGIFALVGLVASLSFLKIKKPILAGLSVGIAFLSGPNFWIFSVLIFPLIYLIRREGGLEELNKSSLMPQIPGFALGLFLSIGLLSTSFLLDPKGLSGIGSGLITLIRSVSIPYEKPVYHSIYLLLAHSILPIFLFVSAYLQSKKKNSSRIFSFLGLSILISVFVCLIFCRNDFSLLLWPVLLAWIGGASYLSSLKLSLTSLKLPSLGLIAFVLTILIYLSIHVKNLAKQSFGSPQFWNISLLIFAGIILLASALWLLTFAWPKAHSYKAFQIAFLVFFGVLSLASSLRALAQQQQFRWLEYLDNSLILPNAEVDRIMHDFTLSGKALEQAGEFSLLDLPVETEWYFKEFYKSSNVTQTVIGLSRNDIPPDSQTPFRGMSVVFERSINWFAKPAGLYLRAIFSNLPAFIDQDAVLWVQTDLFTGATQ
ncbi:MAG TPA: hypothetical protein GX730_00220 [Chloroflexi bacterium]|nr:hypothetical protein [Chloroflexota bacterium]